MITEAFSNSLCRSFPSWPMGVTRILIFGFSTFFFWVDVSPFYPDSVLFESWQPIGFFKILSRPLSREELDVIIWAFRVFGIMATLGLITRLSCLLAAGFALFKFSYYYNFTEVYHHSHMIALALVLIAISPGISRLSVDRILLQAIGKKLNVARFIPAWSVQAIRIWIVLVYFTSGLQKLRFGDGFDWTFSPNLAIRILGNPFMNETSVWFLNQPVWIIRAFAFGALAVEVFAPLALIHRKLFYFFSVAWIFFHFGVTQIFGGHHKFLSQNVVILSCCFLLYVLSSRRLSQARNMEVVGP